MEIGEGETRCFWLEPTGTGRIGLRRFTFSSAADPDRELNCPAGPSGCDASRELRREHPLEWQTDADGYVTLAVVPDEISPPRTSSSWPRRCGACGNPFPRRPVGQWQVSWLEGYVRSDTGEKIFARHAMGREFAGALYDGRWLHGEGGRGFYEIQDRGDGIALVAVCPNGLYWVVDGKATGGGFWERSGDPRQPETLTVAPSIRAGDYHGFLQAGVFSAHIG